MGRPICGFGQSGWEIWRAPMRPDNWTGRQHSVSIPDQILSHLVSFPFLHEVSDWVFPISAEEAAVEPSELTRFIVFSVDVTAE